MLIYYSENQPEKLVDRNLKEDFFSFLSIFLPYLIFFKVPQHLRRAPLQKIIKYGKNMGKNVNNPSSSCDQSIITSIPRYITNAYDTEYISPYEIFSILSSTNNF